jgi:FkbM family methyltransferase
MNIVQIGCHDGNDHVYKFINENLAFIKTAHLIEPIKENLLKAVDLYKNFEFVNLHELAIVDNDLINEIEIFYPEDINESQTASILKSHSQYFQSNLKSVIVSCQSLNKFFKLNNINDIDRLYIDTEGLDCKIIDSIDFNLYNIKYIEYEYIHSDGTHQSGKMDKYIENKLITHGYQIFDSPPFNKIAIKK